MLKKTLFFLTLTVNTYAQKNEISVFAVDQNTNHKIKLNPNQTITYNQNLIEVSFNFPIVNNDFEFYISGIHSNSIVLKPNHAFFYGNLQGGDYVIHVLKNKTEISSFKFTIEEAFYLKWWFIVSIFLWVVATISLILYFSFLYRFRQQTKLQRVRDNIASDLHDDVGATLSSISFFGEMMRSKIIKNAPKEEVLPLLDKLISTSKETIETMRGVVWTINPNNDNAVDFFQKLQTFGKEMLSAKTIAYDLSIEGFENVKLPLEVQRNFFLFYKETINNIAKHSKATTVEATIKPQKEGIAFGINDNGVGFNPAEIYEGHGLKSLRKRAEELEGSLEIQSIERKGTTINLYFPLP